MFTPETKPKTVVELFEGHPERWIKGNYGEDLEGIACLSKSPFACKWCLQGAINKVYADDADKRFNTNIKLRASVGMLFDWNDAPERTFEEVLAKCKELGI